MATDNQKLPLQGLDDHDAFQIRDQFAANVRNVRSLRERITRSPGGTLLAPCPVPGSGATENGASMGYFTQKTTGTGSQVIPHTLGSIPKALLIFGGGPISGSPTLDTTLNNFSFSYGMYDGTTQRVGVSAGSGAGAHLSDTSHRWANAVYAQMDPVTVLSGATKAQASVTGLSPTDFTLNWTINDNVARTIAWIALGSASISTEVIDWEYDQSSGNQTITGTSFTPQLVIHMTTFGSGTTGGPFSNGNFSGARFCLGAMTTLNQWATQEDVPTGGTLTESWVATNKCLVWGINAVHGVNGPVELFPILAANFVSMNANGFTIHKQQYSASGFPDFRVASLCIAGLPQVKLGALGTPLPMGAPTHTSTTGVGFMPQIVLTSSDGLPIDNSVSIGTSYSIGATDGVSQYTAAISHRPNTGSTGRSYTSTSQTEVQLSTSTDGPKYAASYYSFDSDGFTLNATTGIQGANPNGTYLALQGLSSTPANEAGIPRNYADLFLGTNDSVEHFLMLTSKDAFNYVPDPGSPTSTGTFHTLGEHYTAPDYLRFSIVNTQGISAWSQGVDNIRQWDGTTVSDLITAGTNHSAKALIAFNERIVSIYPTVVGTTHPTQIRWSVNGNVNDWTGTGSGVLEVIDSGSPFSQFPLVTGFVLGDRAYLAKQRELIELIATGTLNPVFGTQPRVSGMGILAPHSVGLAEQFAFWLGPDDVYMWDGSTLTAVGDRVYNTICAHIDYQALDQIQGTVYTPDSQYWLVVPPYIFIYDYRRDIWDWDDAQNFAAIGVYNVSKPPSALFTGDIDKSEFLVVGDPLCQTTRVDFQANSWLGNPIDSYFETKDYTAEELIKSTLGGGWHVTLWDLNSLREVRFQSIPGNTVEVAISLDRGVNWMDVQNVLVNSFGMGVAWFQRPFSQIRFRFRRNSVDSYEIRGQWGHDIENSGYQYG